MTELWLVEWRRNAYYDQTGKPQDGYVVHERVTVSDTGRRADVDDGYSVHKDHAKFFRDAEGSREWKIWVETVDYSGGSHVVFLGKNLNPYLDRAFWQLPPTRKWGYVYSDGRPVSHYVEQRGSTITRIE